MTDIKLKADCELEKALGEYSRALQEFAWSKGGYDKVMMTRAHLLEVIHRMLLGVQNRRGHPTDKANEIMGVVSDE